MHTVYMLRTPDSRVYIGTTSTSLETRWNNGNGYRFCEPLWKVICEVGWENIEKKILGENLTEEEACLLEQQMIELFDSTNPCNGYNREGGGTLKRKIVLEESKKKMSDSKMGEKNPNYGTHFSDERKRKIAESNRGQKRSDETKRKISKIRSVSVNQYDLSGNYIKTWPSAKVACDNLGISQGHITKVCKNQRKTSGGYVWKYAN